MALLPATMLIAGCITPVAPESVYRLTSDPEGAEIYVGTSPDQLGYYVTTPFERRTSQSLNWSQRYFQARKDGYEDSEIHLQPTFLMGHPINIHFDLEPTVTRSDFETYRKRDSVEAYYEFLERYPDPPFVDEVFERLVERISERPDAAAQYRELLETYPDAAPHVMNHQLAELESRTRPESDATAESAAQAPGTGTGDDPTAADTTTADLNDAPTAEDAHAHADQAPARTEPDQQNEQRTATEAPSASEATTGGNFEADLLDGFWITQIPIHSGRTGEYAGYDHIWEMRFLRGRPNHNDNPVWRTQPGAEGRVWFTRKYFQLGAVRGEPATGVYDWWYDGDLVRVGHVSTGAARFTIDPADMSQILGSEKYYPLERGQQVDCNLGVGVWREGSYRVDRCRLMNSL
ncbi:hypothetical protein [Thioalkalivibrio sp. AKL19]|uniref:hypothetical protein n=1 Tax=Thioalkalivibrio sp. AKL19 TaxID=1266914 RepID=UPI000462A825|nr:hypothetical protein [Thioalkalivibrio sp. AKL19]